MIVQCEASKIWAYNCSCCKGSGQIDPKAEPKTVSAEKACWDARVKPLMLSLYYIFLFVCLFFVEPVVLLGLQDRFCHSLCHDTKT